MAFAIINLINLLFEIFSVLILVEVIGSWLMAARMRLPGWAYDLLHTVHLITAPVLNPIRRVIPSLGGLDLSPLIALVLLDVVRRLLVSVFLGLR